MEKTICIYNNTLLSYYNDKEYVVVAHTDKDTRTGNIGHYPLDATTIPCALNKLNHIDEEQLLKLLSDKDYYHIEVAILHIFIAYINSVIPSKYLHNNFIKNYICDSLVDVIIQAIKYRIENK